MKNPVIVESAASASIDAKIHALADWRGATLARVRALIHAADPEIVEEWKWVKPTSPGTPVFSRAGIVCTGETYKSVVKLTFAKGASLPDPAGLFNSSLEGNVRRAIDIHETDTLDEPALQALIRAAVALNLADKNKAKPKLKSKLKREPRLSDSQIDEAILAEAGTSWKKVAMVIFKTTNRIGNKFPPTDEGCDLITGRLEALVRDCRLIAKGDVRKPRSSEVRLPH